MRANSPSSCRPSLVLTILRRRFSLARCHIIRFNKAVIGLRISYSERRHTTHTQLLIRSSYCLVVVSKIFSGCRTQLPELPDSVWTQVGRCKENRFRWSFADGTDLAYDCGLKYGPSAIMPRVPWKLHRRRAYVCYGKRYTGGKLLGPTHLKVRRITSDTLRRRRRFPTPLLSHRLLTHSPVSSMSVRRCLLSSGGGCAGSGGRLAAACSARAPAPPRTVMIHGSSASPSPRLHSSLETQKDISMSWFISLWYDVGHFF